MIGCLFTCGYIGGSIRRALGGKEVRPARSTARKTGVSFSIISDHSSLL
jgi:hypothetical protein